MTAVEVGKLVKFLLGAYPHQAVKVDRRAMTLAYGVGLVDLDAAQCLAAAVELCKTEPEWIPSIAKIRSRVVAMNHGEKRSGIAAWGDVVKLGASTHTREISDVITDPAVVACVDSLGWIRRDETQRGGITVRRWRLSRDAEDEVSDRARFVELYDGLASHTFRAVQLAPGAKSRALPSRTEETRGLDGLIRGLLTTTTEDEDGHDIDED